MSRVLLWRHVRAVARPLVEVRLAPVWRDEDTPTEQMELAASKGRRGGGCMMEACDGCAVSVSLEAHRRDLPARAQAGGHLPIRHVEGHCARRRHRVNAHTEGEAHGQGA